MQLLGMARNTMLKPIFQGSTSSQERNSEGRGGGGIDIARPSIHPRLSITSCITFSCREGTMLGVVKNLHARVTMLTAGSATAWSAGGAVGSRGAAASCWPGGTARLLPLPLFLTGEVCSASASSFPRFCPALQRAQYGLRSCLSQFFILSLMRARLLPKQCQEVHH